MNNNGNPPVIGITIGDLNGVGLEVIIKTFADSRLLQYCTPVIYGSTGAINFYRKSMEGFAFNFSQVHSASDAKPNRVNVVNSWNDMVRINFGQPSSETGHYAILSLEHAVKEANENKLQAIVTAPIDKHTAQSEKFHFPGHTEYITQAFGRNDSLMFMIGEHFRIGMVTGHLPVKDIAAAVTTEKIISKLKIMGQSLLVDFAIRKPRIAVLGLNPHAGDHGLLGKEENEVIVPAIEAMKDSGSIVMGPYPADGFFGSRMYEQFDAVLGMYHDQALGPFKLLNFESGVNYTAGLPIVRTSPDHGTGYAIAGKNEANESSFREAVFLASEIVRNRKMFIEINKDPLKSQVTREKEI